MACLARDPGPCEPLYSLPNKSVKVDLLSGVETNCGVLYPYCETAIGRLIRLKSAEDSYLG